MRIATVGTARKVTWLPNWLTVSPVQSLRKSRCRQSLPFSIRLIIALAGFGRLPTRPDREAFRSRLDDGLSFRLINSERSQGVRFYRRPPIKPALARDSSRFA